MRQRRPAQPAQLAQAPPQPVEQPVEPGTGGWSGDAGASAPDRVWLTGDYLLWWIKSAPNPVPLVSTGPFNPSTYVPGVSPIPAALGSPGTQVLFGDKDIGFNALSGLRLQGGINLDPDSNFGIEAGAFFLQQASTTFSAESDQRGNPFLAFPVRNALTGQEVIDPLSFSSPGVLGQAGGVNITTTSLLWGGKANLALNLISDSSFRVTALVGFRYLSLDEQMGIAAAYTPLFAGVALNAPLPFVNPGDYVNIGDTFHTRNEFYGGQVGGRFGYTLDIFDVDLTAKVGVGSTEERSEISGSTVVQGPGLNPVSFPAGTFTS